MRQNYFKALIVISLIVLLASCGQSNQLKSNVAIAATPQPTQGISFDVANLHIYSALGFHCMHHLPFPLNLDSRPNYPDGNLVLATDHLTYDSAELQQMTTYLATLFDLTNLPLTAPPNTLQWVSGSTLGDNKSAVAISGCYGEMDVTNIGKTTIQIRSMNVRLTAIPRQNTYQYRLIDDCSLLPRQVPCQLGGTAGGTPGLYYFQLSKGNIGQVYSSQNQVLFGQSPLGEITLNPSDSTEIYASFDSSPDNLIYTILPELVLDTPAGQKAIALPKLAGMLYFANTSQFSCYSLRGDTFFLLNDKAIPDSSFCI